MKPREFYKIMEEFVKEDKRWRALRVGDIIYEERCAGMEFEYCEMKIEAIDINERIVNARDTSGGKHFSRNISNFLTSFEFSKKSYK